MSWQPAVDDGRLNRLGARLRRVRGIPLILDARLAVRADRARRSARRREEALAERDRRWLASWEDRHDLRINVGSSSRHIEGWISADILRDPEGRCLRMDATQPWPFASDSAAAIASEHVIEHIDPAAMPAFIAEAYRVLRPGGVLRLSTPNLRGIAEAYLNADAETLAAHRAHGYMAATHADLLNNYLHEFGHVHVYDAESLRLLLVGAGFSDVREASFGHSEYPELRGIDQHDPAPLDDLVLWLDAAKPGARPQDQ
jgi:predicted SAM-dependent methyltransferase